MSERKWFIALAGPDEIYSRWTVDEAFIDRLLDELPSDTRLGTFKLEPVKPE